MFRTGLGYDSHRFAPGRALVLGGVTIPDAPGLAGHSDADAVLHAVTDALPLGPSRKVLKRALREALATGGLVAFKASDSPKQTL